MKDVTINEKVQTLISDLKKLTYTWRSSTGSDTYTSNVINKEGLDRVEQTIRAFLIDNRDNEYIKLKAEISILEAKVFMYEQIISKSNFAPMVCESSVDEQ